MPTASCGCSRRSGRPGRRGTGIGRGVRGGVRRALLSLSFLSAAFLPLPAGAADIDVLARTLMSSIVDGSRVALLPLDRRVGLPEEAHRRFYDALANALGRSAKRGIRMVSGPRQRAIYRHLVETYEKDLDAKLKSILESAKADFVVICLWKTDDPKGFVLSCAPSGVETIERLDGGDVRFEWDSEAEYLEFVVARLARNVLGNRDVGGVQEVRMHDRRFGGRTDLTDFVTDLLQQEAMEVAGERGFPGAGEGAGEGYRVEGEVWHPNDERIRLRVRLYRGGGSDGGGRLVSGDDVYLAVSSLPANLRPLEMTLVDETRWAVRRSTVRSRPGGREKVGALDAGMEVYVTSRVQGRRGREWLGVELEDDTRGFVLASSLSETRSVAPDEDGTAQPASPGAGGQAAPESGSAEAEAETPSVAEGEREESTAAAEADEEPGRRFRDCEGTWCPEMVVVPAGSYMMGSPDSEAGRGDDEGPRHRVRIAKPFAVGVNEVTRREFGRFVRETGHSTGDACWTYEDGEWKERSGRSWRNPGFSQTDGHPVVCVSWEDAQEYVHWLSRETGERYRLLSEAEWEYVARAGTETSSYWGDGETGQCVHANGADDSAGLEWGVSCDDGHTRTSPAGSFTKNGFGIHDVLGNVWEWVEGCWHDSYAGAPGDGRAWTVGGDCSRRVMRGGAWYLEPQNLRSAYRGRFPAGIWSDVAGFRVARTLD